MFAALLPLVLFVGGPFALPWLVALLRGIYNWKMHVMFMRPVSRGEKAAVWILLAFICSNVFQIAVKPARSYFLITRTPTDSPAYMIRNRFRSYISEQENADIRFKIMMSERAAGLKPHTNEHGIVNPEALDAIYSGYSDLESKYIELERLSNELRSGLYRKRYILYGKDAAECEVCNSGSESMNFAFVVLTSVPHVILRYIAALIVMGIVSSFESKRGWRLPAACLILIFCLCEVAFISLSEDATFLPSFYMLQAKNVQCMTRPEQLNLARSLVLLILGTVVLVFDIKGKQSPLVSSLHAIVSFIESSIARLQTSRLARMSAMRDDTLRKFCWEFYKNEARDAQHLFSNPEYKALQADFARKYRLDDLEKAASANVQSAMDVLFSS